MHHATFLNLMVSFEHAGHQGAMTKAKRMRTFCNCWMMRSPLYFLVLPRKMSWRLGLARTHGNKQQTGPQQLALTEAGQLSSQFSANKVYLQSQDVPRQPASTQGLESCGVHAAGLPLLEASACTPVARSMKPRSGTSDGRKSHHTLQTWVAALAVGNFILFNSELFSCVQRIVLHTSRSSCHLLGQ